MKWVLFAEAYVKNGFDAFHKRLILIFFCRKDCGPKVLFCWVLYRVHFVVVFWVLLSFCKQCWTLGRYLGPLDDFEVYFYVLFSGFREPFTLGLAWSHYQNWRLWPLCGTLWLVAARRLSSSEFSDLSSVKLLSGSFDISWFPTQQNSAFSLEGPSAGSGAPALYSALLATISPAEETLVFPTL